MIWLGRMREFQTELTSIKSNAPGIAYLPGGALLLEEIEIH